MSGHGRYANVVWGFLASSAAWAVVSLVVPHRQFPEGAVLLPLLFVVGVGLARRRPSCFLEATVGTIIAGWLALVLFAGAPLSTRSAQSAVLPAVLCSSATLLGEIVGILTSWLKRRRHRVGAT